MDRFNQIDDYVSDDQINSIREFFEKQVLWTFGWLSNRDKTPFGHWNHDFLKTSRANQENREGILFENPDLAPIRDLWLTLKKNNLADHALVRCYANAHTFGVEGYPHVDSRNPGNYTTIFYINPIWKPEWAGETVFLNDAGDIFRAVLPKPGRCVIFDGRLTHAARALTRLCPALRVTLMFKTRAPGAESDSE